MVLPVKQSAYTGLAEVNGLIRAEEAELVFEYQLQDEVLGMFNSDVKTCRVSFEYIDRIEVEREWFVWQFNIYLNKLPQLKKHLRVKDNCLSLTIKRKNLEKARNIRSKLMLDISELKLQNLEKDEKASDKSHAETDWERIEIREREDNRNEMKPGGLKNMLRNEDSD